VLDEVRRGCRRFGVVHKYHQAAGVADPDAYMVVGEYDQATDDAAGLERAAREVRARLRRTRCVCAPAWRSSGWSRTRTGGCRQGRPSRSRSAGPRSTAGSSSCWRGRDWSPTPAALSPKARVPVRLLARLNGDDLQPQHPTTEEP
jgi:hypothetical protein